jgi:hypothetical protein
MSNLMEICLTWKVKSWNSLVEVDLINVELFHTTVITYLHYNMHTFTIFVLILNTLDFVVH